MIDPEEIENSNKKEEFDQKFSHNEYQVFKKSKNSNQLIDQINYSSCRLLESLETSNKNSNHSKQNKKPQSRENIEGMPLKINRPQKFKNGPINLITNSNAIQKSKNVLKFDIEKYRVDSKDFKRIIGQYKINIDSLEDEKKNSSGNFGNLFI